jgi:hypothetical protein
VEFVNVLYDWFQQFGRDETLSKFSNDMVYANAACEYCLKEIIGFTGSRPSSLDVQFLDNVVVQTGAGPVDQQDCFAFL